MRSSFSLLACSQKSSRLVQMRLRRDAWLNAIAFFVEVGWYDFEWRYALLSVGFVKSVVVSFLFRSLTVVSRKSIFSLE